MTKFCSNCRKNGHTLMYCRTKASMIRLKNKRRYNQSSLMTTIREEARSLGVRIVKISVSNPDTEARTTRHPINELAPTQIGTEIQTQIDNFNKPDQATPGTTDQITVIRLSITSMLDQRILILSTTKTFRRTTTYLHPTQFNSSTIRNNM